MVLLLILAAWWASSLARKTITLQIFHPLAKTFVTNDQSNNFRKGMTLYTAGRYAEALKMFHHAVEEGDVNAMVQIGLMHDLGVGVPADGLEASRWYRGAADLDDGRAQYMLAHLHEYGEGMPVDLQQAFYWYKKAADLGDVDAQFAVGRFYLEGSLAPPNPAFGEQWLRKAASHGHKRAHEFVTNRSGQVLIGLAR